MTNTELIQAIRNEIERRITDNTFGAKLELIDILAWLDSLESEKPIEGLEEEVKRYYSDNFEYISSDQPTLSILTNIARHFAEWGYFRAAEKYNEIEYNRQRAEESVQNDLEEAAKEFANQDCVTFISRKNGFIAGAKWQKEQDEKEQADLFTIVALDAAQRAKEQMMKEAVEGEAHPDDCEIWVNLVGYGYKFNDGDKVRVIVLPKEDEK